MPNLSETALIIDPVGLVAPDARLFIDTNVFMETNPEYKGGLQKLFLRVAPKIEEDGSPVIVPTKVVNELTKQSSQIAGDDDPRRALASSKAENALLFIRSASERGLIRADLGDDSNPYADDLFVDILTAYADRYSMALLTHDITLQLRVNLLGIQREASIIAGRLNSAGLVELDSPQMLYERGCSKLRRIQRRLGTPEETVNDNLEAESLDSVLQEFANATDVVKPSGATPDRILRTAAVRQPHADSFPIDTPYRGNDAPLDVSEIPVEGDEVIVEMVTGTQKLRLSDKLGTGGEGSVYSISSTHVVKIYDKDHVTAHRRAKIELLSGRGLEAPGICFPQAVVRNLQGEFVGYMMPRASGRDFSKALFNPRRFRTTYPGWTKSDLVDVAISFLEKVAYLHSLNIVLGDINPKNLQVDENKDVWIIDADSWQVDGYPCPVGTEMFSAPQVIGKRYPEFLRSIEDERYAVATMLFMILITGQFPYSRSGSDGDIVKLIKEGNFAFQYKDNSNQDQPAGNWKYMWSHLHPNLKGLFWHTFHREGERYEDRPTDDEWLYAFRIFRRYLSGPESFDPMSNDVYPTRFKAMARDTPIYECGDCGTSLAGMWNDKSKKYIKPALCQACRNNLPKCVDCSKSSSNLRDGICWECNRKRNFTACAQCKQEKLKKSLVDGRCFDCNQGVCADCGRQIPKRHLEEGLCDRCVPINCKDCVRKFRKSSTTYGRCQECHQKDILRQKRAQEIAAEKARRDAELEPSRLCTRCRKPFISRGNIAWHERVGKTVPTTHKAGPRHTFPAECVPTSKPNQSSKHSPKSETSGGCYIATSVYGSYEAPQVWVLRRWRDDTLRKTALGRSFVNIYYRWSPSVVDKVGTSKVFSVPARLVLNRVVHLLRLKGVSDAPYKDR